jgi:hypothetical protein
MQIGRQDAAQLVMFCPPSLALSSLRLASRHASPHWWHTSHGTRLSTRPLHGATAHGRRYAGFPSGGAWRKVWVFRCTKLAIWIQLQAT